MVNRTVVTFAGAGNTSTWSIGVAHRATQDGQFHDKRVGVYLAGAYALADGIGT